MHTKNNCIQEIGGPPRKKFKNRRTQMDTVKFEVYTKWQKK